jgi:hypothetical protein
MHRISIQAVVTALVCVGPVFAVSTVSKLSPLAYRLPVSDQFRQITNLTVKSPQGTKTGTITMVATVKGATSHGMRWGENVTMAMSGAPAKQAALELTMPPDGNWTELTVSSGPENLARVAQMTLPALPNTVVGVGSVWETERTFTLPQTGAGRIPESIRVRSQYKVSGVENIRGRPAVNFTMVATDTGRQTVTLKANAIYSVDLLTGKPIKSRYEALLNIRVGLIWVKVQLSAVSAVN